MPPFPSPFLPNLLRPDLLRPGIHSQFNRASSLLYSWSFSIAKRMLKIVYFYQTPLLRIAAGTASPFITSRPMTTVKTAFFSLSTTIQMIATSEIRISVSEYWILSIINQALSKTKELPEIESRYFASEEEFRSLLASRQFIKAVILTDVCRYRFYAIPKLCIIAEFFTLHIPLALCPV